MADLGLGGRDGRRGGDPGAAARSTGAGTGRPTAPAAAAITLAAGRGSTSAAARPVEAAPRATTPAAAQPAAIPMRRRRRTRRVGPAGPELVEAGDRGHLAAGGVGGPAHVGVGDGGGDESDALPGAAEVVAHQVAEGGVDLDVGEGLGGIARHGPSRAVTAAAG